MYRVPGILLGAWIGVLATWKWSGSALDREWKWILAAVIVPTFAVIGWYLGGEQVRRERRKTERLRH